MKYLITPLLFISFSFVGYSQQLDTAVSSTTAAVRIYENPGFRLLAGHHQEQGSTIRKARGYRIQIYNGIDRQKAKAIQLEFMRQHPGVPAYFGYDRPHFRVRVGDFLNRQASNDLYNSLQRKYTCIIVPDIINVKQ
jgi:hypothetical protein